MPSTKHKQSTTPSRLSFKKPWKGIMIALGIILGIFALVGILNTFVFLPIKNPSYGVTFSKERAQEFDLNWQETFTALLDDMGLKRYRLVSYWYEIEPQRGTFDFKDLDWQFAEANKRGAKISLAIGLRQPRWPECHQPAWSLELKGNEWKQALYAYMEQVVNRYKDNPALESWQLENEAMNNWFGMCEDPDRQRLEEELALVKKWDTKHPVIMSLSDQHGLPFGKPVPDVYGFSVYRIVYNTFGPHFYTYYPTPIWYHRLRAAIITAMHHKPIMVHELQLEPWGPRDTKFLSIEEQNKSMSVQQIPKSIMFARQIGLKEIDLWGAEWWYWRKTTFNDNSVWDTVKREINRQ